MRDVMDSDDRGRSMDMAKLPSRGESERCSVRNDVSGIIYCRGDSRLVGMNSMELNTDRHECEEQNDCNRSLRRSLSQPRSGGDRRSASQRDAASGSRQHQGGEGGLSSCTLYISNVPPRCSIRDIRRIFEEVGEIQDCRIVNNPVTRESRGFAFVSYVDPDNSAIAIERLDGKAVIGDPHRPLKVERAKRNKPHNPTPGYYKGPPGASVKYDKAGRLKPGFLPYYAVAPGASRDFVPAHNAYHMNYYNNGQRYGRNAVGRWHDEREYGPRIGYESSGGGRLNERMEYGNMGHSRSMHDMRGCGADVDMAREGGRSLIGRSGYDGRASYRNMYDNRAVGYDMRGAAMDVRSGVFETRQPYDSRGNVYETRGAPFDVRGGANDRSASGVYDPRHSGRGGYDSRNQYDAPRSEHRVGSYGGYTPYLSTADGGGGYGYGGGRDTKMIARDRSRSRDRKEKHRSISPRYRASHRGHRR